MLNKVTRQLKKLDKIGYYIGMSYQIIDDILDFTSTEKKLGKPVGSDLRNGHLTYQYYLEWKNSKQFKDKIQQLSIDSSDEVFNAVIQEVIDSEELQKSKEVVILLKSGKINQFSRKWIRPKNASWNY